MHKRELIGRIKLNHDPRQKRKGPTPVCGAKTRSGAPCQNTAIHSNGRCRMHGGTRSKGYKKKTEGKGRKTSRTREEAQKGAVIHGIYADSFLLDDEYQVYPNVVGKVGTLDEEIHANRVMLRRALSYQSKMDKVKDELAKAARDKDEYIRVALSHSLLTVKEIEEHKDQVLTGAKDDRYIEDIAKSRMIRKLADYNVEIRKYTTTIQKLERARRELLETEDWGDDFVRKLAEDLRKFSDNADTTIQPGFGAGNYQDLATTVTQ